MAELFSPVGGGNPTRRQKQRQKKVLGRPAPRPERVDNNVTIPSGVSGTAGSGPIINRSATNNLKPTTPTRKPSEYLFNTIDMFTDRDRYAKSRLFLDRGGYGFDLKKKDTQALINAGLLSYAKNPNTGLRETVLTGSPQAVERLLDDNFNLNITKKGNIDPKRKTSKLKITDAFKILSAGSVSAFDTNQATYRDPRLLWTQFEDVPSKTIKDPVTGKEVKYADRAEQARVYASDKETEAKFDERWQQHVKDKGGSAQLNNLLEVYNDKKHTPEELESAINAIRPYLYSPNSTYKNAQESFINSLRGSNTFERSQALTNQRIVEQQKDYEDARIRNTYGSQEAFDKAKDEAVKFFDPTTNPIASTPEGQVALLEQYLTTGRSELIPEYVYRNLLGQNYTRVNDPNTPGGFTYVKQRGVLDNPAALSSMVGLLNTLTEQGAPLPFDQKDLNTIADAARKQQEVAQWEYDTSTDQKKNPWNLYLPDPLGVFGKIGKDIQDETMDPNTTIGGWLAPTPLKEGETPSVGAFTGNFIKGLAKGATGFPYGIYMLTTNPSGTAVAGVQDYKARYNFSEPDKVGKQFYEDPSSYVFDALSVVPAIGWGVKSAQIASKASMLARAGRVGDLGLLEYSRLSRQAAAGNYGARLALEEVLPKGTDGSNSLFIPTSMDRAAALFEPRYEIVSRAAGTRQGVTEAVKGLEAAGPDTTIRIRYSGNPLSRGIQKNYLRLQTAISKAVTSPESRTGKALAAVEAATGVRARLDWMTEIPGLGFDFRYNRARSMGEYGTNELMARDIYLAKAYNKMIDDYGFSDMENMVIADMVTGGAYSPAIYRSLYDRALKEAAAQGRKLEVDELMQLDEAYLRRLESPEWQAEYARIREDAMREAPETTRGKEMQKARNMLITLLEKNNRALTGTITPEELGLYFNAYAPITRALRLDTPDVVAELGADAQNIAMFNPNRHFNELYGEYPDDLISGPDGQLVLHPDASNVGKLIAQSLEILKTDRSTRNLGGHPVYVVDEVMDMGDGFEVVRGRRMVLDGEFDNVSGAATRRGLIDSTPIYLPKSAFVLNKKGGIKMIDSEDAISQVQVAALNTLVKAFPNVRDFTDKISDININGPESFAARKTRNEVIASALHDYNLKIQLDATVASIKARYAERMKEQVLGAAFPVSMAEFNPKVHKALGFKEIFDSYDEAASYSSYVDEAGKIQENPIEEIMIDGKPRFMIERKFFDTNAAALREGRSKRLEDAALEADKTFFTDISKIQRRGKPEDQYVMVIPKADYLELGRSVKRANKFAQILLEGGNNLSSIFKILTLSLNPRFLAQNIFGGVVMLMLAKPEWAAQTMASMITYSARKAAGKVEGADQYAAHVDDLNFFNRIFPTDFDHYHIYAQDRMQGFLGRVGDSKLGKYSIYSGYTTVAAFESTMRTAILRQAALAYPGFKTLMKSDAVKARAAMGDSDWGLETISPFQAAVKIMSERDKNFLFEIRHAADSVVGNYRNFSDFERTVRNYLLPFYAWQRHSAVFTKRLIQERPITANLAYNIGNYGYEQLMAGGGVPDWLMGKVPMPSALERIFGNEDGYQNLIGLDAVSPFATTGDATKYIGGSLFEGSIVPRGGIFDYTNPFINAAVEKYTGASLLTGAPLDTKKKNQTLFRDMVDTFSSFPTIGLIMKAFKDDIELNDMRGGASPDSILDDPNDPSKGITVPGDKLSKQYATLSAPGIFNAFSPVKGYQINTKAAAEAFKKEMRDRGLEVPDSSIEITDSYARTFNAIRNYEKKKKFVYEVWLPRFGEQYPELASKVIAALEADAPKIPKSFPQNIYNAAVQGG